MPAADSMARKLSSEPSALAVGASAMAAAVAQAVVTPLLSMFATLLSSDLFARPGTQMHPWSRRFAPFFQIVC
jgi:hypothetical protein